MTTEIYCAPHHRMALFIDGESFSSALRALNAQVDYRKLLRFFRSQARLVHASYYALVPGEGFATIRPLLDWLSYNGFTVNQKRMREHGTRRGSFAIDLAVDVLTYAPNVETIILVTGDQQYRVLVEEIQRKGVRAIVLSTLSADPPLVADELRRQADQFLELAHLLPLVELKRKSQTPSSAL